MFVFYNRGIYAASIARTLGISALYPRQNRLIKRNNNLSRLVNWGCRPSVLKAVGIKDGMNQDINTAVSKVRTFAALEKANVHFPPYSTDWRTIAGRGKYLARTDFQTGGRGIVILDKDSPPPSDRTFDFYSLVIAKSYELRLHIFGDQVICEQFKFIPSGSKVLIRSYDNGARFSNKSLEHHLTPELSGKVRTTAIAAVRAVGIDFGAVDLFIGAKTNDVYVLEVNTAPGLSSQEEMNFDMPGSYDAYLAAFRTLVV